MSKLAVYALLFCVGFCWATTPIFVVGASWLPLGTVAVRACLSGIAMLAFVPKGTFSLAKGKSLIRIAPSGIAAALSTSCFALAFLYAESGKVYVLYYTFPLFNAVWSSFVSRELPRGIEIAALILALLGLSVTFSADLYSSSLGIGELVALASAVFWTLHIILAQRLPGKSDVHSANAFGQLLLGGLLLPLTAISAEMPTVNQALCLVALGLFSCIALICWSAAISEVPGHVAGTLTMIEAPGGVLLMYLFFGGQIPFSLLFGGLLVLTAGALAMSQAKVEESDS